LRNGLGEGQVDGAALAKPLVELVGELGLLVDAGLDALLAAGAEVLADVAGAAPDAHLVVAHVAVHLLDVGVGP